MRKGSRVQPAEHVMLERSARGFFVAIREADRRRVSLAFIEILSRSGAMASMASFFAHQQAASAET